MNMYDCIPINTYLWVPNTRITILYEFIGYMVNDSNEVYKNKLIAKSSILYTLHTSNFYTNYLLFVDVSKIENFIAGYNIIRF